MICHALFDRDEGVGGGEDGLETKTVPPDHDAYHALLVGNEQNHRDAVLRDEKKKQTRTRKGPLRRAAKQTYKRENRKTQSEGTPRPDLFIYHTLRHQLWTHEYVQVYHKRNLLEGEDNITSVRSTYLLQ